MMYTIVYSPWQLDSPELSKGLGQGSGLAGAEPPQQKVSRLQHKIWIIISVLERAQLEILEDAARITFCNERDMM